MCVHACPCVSCKNDLNDQDAIWGADSSGPNPKERVLGGVQIPHGKGQF